MGHKPVALKNRFIWHIGVHEKSSEILKSKFSFLLINAKRLLRQEKNKRFWFENFTAAYKLKSESVCKTFNVFEYRLNMGYVVLIYKYIQYKRSTEIKEICPPINTTFLTFPPISPRVTYITHKRLQRLVVLYAYYPPLEQSTSRGLHF